MACLRSNRREPCSGRDAWVAVLPGGHPLARRLNEEGVSLAEQSFNSTFQINQRVKNAPRAGFLV
ncbi:hypothetical protein EI534_21175 [Pseudomonas frederiksbergensis]|nr:hypothetical protein [Pseudomonas frederiksbergensis]